MSKQKKPRRRSNYSGRTCPACKSKKTVQSLPGFYYCYNCDGYFDDSPDEGGDYWDNPTLRAQRAESRE